MYECIIVGDDKSSRMVLSKLISQFDFLTLIAACENPLQAVNILEKEKIDLIFLDVEMPEMTGLEFIKTGLSSMIILITSKRDYAVEAFEHNVINYLVKPLSSERFLKAINKAMEFFKEKEKTKEIHYEEFVSVRNKGILIRLDISQILFIQALGDYITIHTISKKYTVRHTLKTLEEKLSPARFMRIHRSYMVAYDKVQSLDDNTVSINNNLIPVSESYRSEFIKKLNLL